MNKFYRYFRVAVALIIGTLSVLAFTGLFYPVKIFDMQFTALAQRLLVDFSTIAILLFVALILVTFLFGRIYCSTLCPFGLYQEFLMLFFRHKNRTQQNKPHKYLIAAIVFGALIGGTACLVRYIDPYTLFASTASGAWFGIGVAVLIAVLVWFKGRMFCTNICPVGAVLGLISKHAVNKIYMNDNLCVSCGLCASKCPTGSIDFKNKSINNETCIKCFKCLDGCNRNSIRYGIKPIRETPFSPSRRNLLISGAVVAAFALAVKGGIDLGKTIAAKIKSHLARRCRKRGRFRQPLPQLQPLRSKLPNENFEKSK